MSLLVPRLGEQRATAMSSPGGRGRAHVIALTPCLPTHFLPSVLALSLPGLYLTGSSQGAVWMWTSYEVGSGSRARNFSNSVMKTCLRTGGQSLVYFTLQKSPFPSLLGVEEIPYPQKKRQIEERSSFLYSYGVCEPGV